MEVIADSEFPDDDVAVMEEDVDPASIEEKTRALSRKRKNIDGQDQENGETVDCEDVSEIRKRRKTGGADVDRVGDYGIVTEGVRKSTTSITTEIQTQSTQQLSNDSTIPPVQGILTERTDSLMVARTTNIVGSSIRQQKNVSPAAPITTSSVASTATETAVFSTTTPVRDRIDALAAPRRRTRPIPEYIVKNYQALTQDDTDLTPRLNEMRQAQDIGEERQQQSVRVSV